MNKKIIGRPTHPDPTDSRKIAEWLAEAGITVDLVEDAPDKCPLCRAPELHVAA